MTFPPSHAAQQEGAAPLRALCIARHCFLSEHLARYFAQMGIANAVTRLNTEFAEPNMPGFQRTYWAVDLPLPGSRSDMSRLLIAVAALEETDSIAKVMDLAIRTEDGTGHRTAIMNVSALTEK